ncbi:MAG: 3-oxoacyl-ACP reductase FabG [Paenibacillaceae bacterium]|nr:3-oxoacyl-ACP reductase FabG [Paenibacillaceae bacterium]
MAAVNQGIDVPPGKVALVTGASRGIGAAIALRLAADGFAVAVHYQSSGSAAAQVAEQIERSGGQTMLVQGDVSGRGGMEPIVTEVAAKWGRIDVFVSNAGIMVDAEIAHTTDEQWERVLATNLDSAFYGCRAVIPHMIAGGFGRIVAISSQAALTGSGGHAHYAAAKAGLLGFVYSLAKELGPSGITVNAVSPGRIDTDMLAARSEGRMEEWLAQTPLRRLGRPEEVAHAVAFLASDEASYITGLNLHVNGGLVMG